MKGCLAAAVALAAVLTAGVAVSAAPPPPAAELTQMLQREPVNAANWKLWAPRLREWSGEHFEAAFPAFSTAFNFIKGQQKTQGNRITLPKALDRDAVAWMMLAGAYLHDATPAQGPVEVARLAQEAARRSINLDRSLARSHFYLCWAHQKEQLTPQQQGGPAQPDIGRLNDALRELKEARGLAPQVAWMSAQEAGRLASRAKRWDDAEAFLRTALEQNPTQVQNAHLLAVAVNELGQSAARPGKRASTSIEALTRQFPADGVLAAQHARALFRDGKGPEAVAELQRARQLGTDPAPVIGVNRTREIEALAAQRAQAETRQQALTTSWTVALLVGLSVLGFVVFYGLVMVSMCLAGLLLAQRTRGPAAAELLGTSAEELTDGGKVARTQHEASLVRFYAVALLVALLLFYASLPFVFFGLLLVFVLTLVLALLARRAPGENDVHGAMLRASGGGIGAVFKAMFARTSGADCGLRQDAEDCPRLFDAIDEVADRVDTEPPDVVYLSPGADFYVYQQGRGPFGVFGGRKRVLMLGLCVMNFLTVSEFKSILAHEFAHFSHADTYWNRFLFQVTLSLRTAMREMARTGGWVTWINPFYWFFWLYSKSYSLLSAGFSRSREFLADRMACTLYGSDAFARGLRKICTDGTHFELTIYSNIGRLLREQKAYVNMYLAFRKFREEQLTKDERRKLDRKLLDDNPSVFASHPTFQERLEAARHLPRARKTDDMPSLQLFEDPEAVERELTDFLTDLMANDHYR